MKNRFFKRVFKTILLRFMYFGGKTREEQINFLLSRQNEAQKWLALIDKTVKKKPSTAPNFTQVIQDHRAIIEECADDLRCLGWHGTTAKTIKER